MTHRLSIRTTPANQLVCGHRRAHTVQCDGHGPATPRKVRAAFYERHPGINMAKVAAPLLIAIRDELRG